MYVIDGFVQKKLWEYAVHKLITCASNAISENYNEMKEERKPHFFCLVLFMLSRFTNLSSIDLYDMNEETCS